MMDDVPEMRITEVDENGDFLRVRYPTAYELGIGWIPVTERFPGDNERKLVTAQTKKGIRSINIAYHDVYGWHGSGSMSNVTAWMDMPEPYKEVELE